MTGEHMSNLCGSAWGSVVLATWLLPIGGVSLAQSPQPLAAIGAGADYEFDRLWPSLPQDWYFNQPNGAATDKAGNVYVVHGFDCVKHRVQKFHPRKTQ